MKWEEEEETLTGVQKKEERTNNGKKQEKTAKGKWGRLLKEGKDKKAPGTQGECSESFRSLFSQKIGKWKSYCTVVVHQVTSRTLVFVAVIICLLVIVYVFLYLSIVITLIKETVQCRNNLIMSSP